MRNLKLTVLILATGAILAACAESTPDPAPTTPAPAASTPDAGATTAAALSLDNPCSLLAEAEIAKILGTAPEPKSKSYGAGFSECIWEGPNRTMVRLSVVPAAALKSDFIDKLNSIGKVPALGEDAILFPGVVGIGYASGGGASVGFTAGEHGIVLAIRTGTDVEKDKSTVTLRGADILKRL